ncbi:MAG TPA: preprotein translocase subunit SecE [Candidatus Saccharimonadales bacterium]|nr:preprotein translocase subunit SecE [Candidatus Saccharimonadales bacterium]
METIINFFRGSYEELKRVQWPSKNETARLTGYVIGVSLGLGLFVSTADYVFKNALGLIIK